VGGGAPPPPPAQGGGGGGGVNTHTALWDCVPRVCGGGSGCAGGGVPLGAVLVLSWCGEVSLGGILINHTTRYRNKKP